jgi:hypothetical protein
MAAGIWFYMTP